LVLMLRALGGKPKWMCVGHMTDGAVCGICEKTAIPLEK